MSAHARSGWRHVFAANCRREPLQGPHRQGILKAAPRVPKRRAENASAQKDPQRVAFVSTRIAGTDGVSLEIAKWAHVIERMGIEFNFDVPRNLTRFDPEVETQLYRIIQEALNNTLKHSSATVVTLKVLKNKGNTELQILDDGIGFEVDFISDKGG